MISKYIKQFMYDNNLSVDEEFFIKNMDGNRVVISFVDRYKIADYADGMNYYYKSTMYECTRCGRNIKGAVLKCKKEQKE